MASIFDNGTIFPYPNGTDLNSIVSLLQYNNTVTGGWFGLGILIIVFFVGVMSLKSFEVNKAWAASSFFTAILALLFTLMGIFESKYLWIVFGFLALGMMWLQFER